MRDIANSLRKRNIRFRKTTIKPTEKVNNFLEKYGSSKIQNGVKLADLIKRSELTYKILGEIDEERPELAEEVIH